MIKYKEEHKTIEVYNCELLMVLLVKLSYIKEIISERILGINIVVRDDIKTNIDTSNKSFL